RRTSSTVFRTIKITHDPLHDPIDLAHLNPATVKFGRILKPADDNASPSTSAVEINGKKYVIKARSTDVDDHVVNTKILRALSIPGVSAPFAVKLTSEFSTALCMKFATEQHAAESGIKDLISALGPTQSSDPTLSYSSQLSELVEGYTLEDLETIQNEVKFIEPVEGLEDAQAIKPLVDNLRKPAHLKTEKDIAQWNMKMESLKKTIAKFDKLKHRKGEIAEAIKQLKSLTPHEKTLSLLSIIERVNSKGMGKVAQEINK